MTNPYDPPKESASNESLRGVSKLTSPLAVLLLGALSSSMLGGFLVYDGTDGALRFAIAMSIGFFVAGAICSLVPAARLRKRLIAGKNVNQSGYYLVALFGMPIASAILIVILFVVITLIAVFTGNFSAT